MGLFALITRWLPESRRRKERVNFAVNPRGPRKLERRRVLDAAGAGVALDAIVEDQPYVQVGENLAFMVEPTDSNSTGDPTAGLSPPLPDASLVAQFPQVSLTLNSVEVFEDGLVQAEIRFTDSEPQPHLLHMDWGDGTTQTIPLPAASIERVVLVHRYLDDNPTGTSSDVNTVTATMTNSFGESGSASADILVKNIAPQFDSLSLSSPTNENGFATLAGTYSEVGSLDTHLLRIDWDGNGTFDQTVTVSGGTFSVSHQYLDDSPSGTASDTFNVIVSLQDDDLGQVTATLQQTVQNVAPRFDSLSITTPTNENGTAILTGTYSDPGSLDTHVLDIDWDGNGTYDQTISVSGGTFSVAHQYLDDVPTGTASDVFDVNVRLRDDDTGQDTGSVELTLNNVAPSIDSLWVTTPINENGTATLVGTYSDIGTLDTHQLDIDWDGDGTYDQTIAVAGGAFSIAHQYLDDNPTGTASDTLNVNVRLRDDDSGQATASVALTVSNVAPQIDSLLVSTPINENDTATLSGTYSDVGSLDSHQLDIDWDGDGTYDQTVVVTGGTFSVVHQYLDDNPTGTPSDTFNVNVRLRDDDTGQATASVPLSVNNIAPTIDSLTITTPINEDGTATLSGTYSDVGTLDTHQLDIDWDGDGTYDQTVVVTGGTFSVVHQYLDDNPTGTPSDTFNVNVRLRDDDTGQATASVPLTVNNIAPHIDSLLITTPINENGTATLSGTYSDIGTLDTHQLDIDWDGDGTYDQMVAVAGGVFSVTHQYLDDNPTGTPSDTFNVNVRLRDDDTGEATASVPLSVNNVAPTIDSLTITTPINEDGTTTLSGTYSDVGTLDTHQLDIDWDGDGTYDQTVVVTGGTFSINHQYLDDDPTGTPSDTFNVNVRLRDDDTGEATASVPLSVNNVAPTIDSLTITTPINEDGTTTLSGTYSDVGTLDTHQLDIDWDGDGTYDQTVVVTGGTFSINHQYLDDDPTGTPSDTFNVNVRLRDDDTGEATASVPLSVNNVAPTIDSLTITTPINEDGTTTLSGTYSDVGTLDTHQLDIDWDGDGTYDQTVVVTGGTFSINHQYLDDNPTGTASDTFNVNVQLRDDDAGQTTASVPLTVNNVAPTVALDPVAMINENEIATLNGSISDVGTLDTFTLEVDWGDPLSPENTQTFSLGTTALTMSADGIEWDPTTRTFSIEHQYLDENPSGTAFDIYTISTKVTDDDTGVGSSTASVRVNNVQLQLTVADDQTIDEGALLDLTGDRLGSFTDVGSLDSHTATVDWGDGSPVAVVAVTEASGNGVLGASHIYADNGVYTVTVTVTDDDTDSDSKSFQVSVLNVDPTLTGVSDPLQVDEGQIFTLSGLGVGLEDPGFDNPANPLLAGGTVETFTAVSVDWGDGSTPDSLMIDTRTNGGENVTTKATFSHMAHAYADNGTYTVSVVVSDDDGGLVTRTFTIVIANVSPTLTLTDGVFEIDEGDTLDLNDLGVFTDPGYNNPLNPNGASVESFHYSIDWGDGTPTEMAQAPATAIDGQQGVATSGTLSDSHLYEDNDADNTYTITVTLFDDDGGFDQHSIQVRVLNVNPTLDPLIATDVTPQGTTILTLSFADPGTDSFEILVDWGDQLALPPDQRFVVETAHVGPTPTTYVLTHQYLGPPDPLHPAADIDIRVKILDDDFGTLGVVEDGESNLQTVTIANPGIGQQFIRIDTTVYVPQLSFPERTQMVDLENASNTNFLFQQGLNVQSGSGELNATTERFLELRVISADGSFSEGFRLRPEVLQDLPALFRTLPDNHYALYVVNLETNTRRLVIEVYVRNGKLIDPGDDSEGTRDRPPTDKQTQEPAPEKVENVDLESVPAAASLPSQSSATLPSIKTFPVSTGVSGFSAVMPKSSWKSGPSRWTAVALGLAASPATQNWARQIDQALAQATATQWRKLQVHNPKKRKKQ
ncbi:hypothetical protein Pr1d_41260 [Bythopirellula goksoeyrii]|uniref:PKD domain-containing protein n=2 Tax=Bythopirellula goksoeyrii TaxID=1400387 RepID=A0A5B9QGV4_9BACT|nr:hypothetical protein Pr1d_41260 [Bythopirellula goksoeyrii]